MIYCSEAKLIYLEITFPTSPSGKEKFIWQGYLQLGKTFLKPTKKLPPVPTNKETALHRCSYKMVFWKFAVNLQEHTHSEERLQ